MINCSLHQYLKKSKMITKKLWPVTAIKLPVHEKDPYAVYGIGIFAYASACFTAPQRGYIFFAYSISLMIFRTGRMEDGLIESSSIPMFTKVSVSSGSAPSSPQIPTQVL